MPDATPTAIEIRAGFSPMAIRLGTVAVVAFAGTAEAVVSSASVLAAVDPPPSLAPHPSSISIEAQFHALAMRWKAQTMGPSSDYLSIITRPAYARIIGLGPRVIPLILSELSREPDHWAWALMALTGEDPVRADDAGDLLAITRAWLHWGEARGLV